MKRLLVTGSRDWDDFLRVDTGLSKAVRDLNAGLLHPTLLVSGNASIGADHMAEHLWAMWGWPVELHPADWRTYGRGAGFRRNAEMVNLSADICVAFIKNHSKGATHTAKLAQAAGIYTIIYTA